MERLMYITPKALKITINEKKYKMEIPISLKYYFVISQVIFGYDYGFTTVLKKALRAPVGHFMSFETCFYLFVLISPIPLNYDSLHAWGPLFEYLLYVCALRSTKYKPYDYIMDVNKYMKIKSSDRKFFLLSSLIYIIAVHVLGIVAVIVFRVLNAKSLLIKTYYLNFPWCYYLIYTFPRLGADTVPFCQIILFYYAYAYVRNLKNELKSSELDTNRVAQRYVHLADIYDKIRPLQNKLMMIQIYCGVPKIMIILYRTLSFMKDNGQTLQVALRLSFSVQGALPLAAQAIVAEMVTSQIDGLKMCLHERLLNETDDRRTAELLRCLRYLEARRLNRLILRFIPMDIKLLLSLISLCITYFIIILQFSHLYD